MKIQCDALIAIIGAGTMGAGIAQVAAAAGHIVRVIDSSEAALARGRESVAASLAALVRRGALDKGQKALIEGRIDWSTELSSAADAALVIEAIVEQLGPKVRLLQALAAIVPASTILASNTSSLSIEAMALALPDPERFLGLHFFNPVPAMKLVEVVGGEQTASAVRDAAIEMVRRWGKRPVAVRDVPGFIVNRVARPYYAEGFIALGEGLPAIAIDEAMTGAGGFRMGPLALADLIGHDVNYAVAKSVFDAYHGKTRFRPQRNQQALFDGGLLGRKTGAGIYDYGRDLPQPVFAAATEPPSAIAVGAECALLAPLIKAARAAGIEVAVHAKLPPETIEIDGARIALGDGRPLAQRGDAVAILDFARDFATARTLIATTRDAGSETSLAGFAQGIRRKILFVPDRPGQIVLRTLAQLANAAADAVADGVATGQGIDEALVYGANHPEGPLGWAARVGFPVVSRALANIAQATDDAIYRPAALFTAENLAG